jgi:hypothetical protein
MARVVLAIWPVPRRAATMEGVSTTERPPLQPSVPAQRSGGAEGNERLTGMTGAVLLAGLLVECYTIVRIGHLLTLHVFLGMLLLGPVTLKAGSVLYRFARYYARNEPYRRKGPPAPLPRVIGPVIMLLTACVFGSGIMLAVTGPGDTGSPGGWLQVHRISFIAWALFAFIHVLAYAWRLPRLLAAEARGVALPGSAAAGSAAAGSAAGSAAAGSAAARRHARRAVEVLGGRGIRLALLTASLLAGLVIALLTVHLAGQWEPGSGF